MRQEVPVHVQRARQKGIDLDFGYNDSVSQLLPDLDLTLLQLPLSVHLIVIQQLQLLSEILVGALVPMPMEVHLVDLGLDDDASHPVEDGLVVLGILHSLAVLQCSGLQLIELDGFVAYQCFVAAELLA